MAERGLGLGPVSFAPLPADGPPRARRSDVVSSGPLFQLVAGNLDRTLRTGSRWSTSASVALHVAVIAFFIAMIPAIGVIAMPDVPSHIVGFVRADAIAATATAWSAAGGRDRGRGAVRTLGAASASGRSDLCGSPQAVAGHHARNRSGGQPARDTRHRCRGRGRMGRLRRREPRRSSNDLETHRAARPSLHRSRFRIGGPIPAPAQTRRVEPIYPDIAVRAKLEGMVIIEAIVDTEGRPQSLNVLRSQGPLLDRAALDAVTQWRYEPLLYHGEAVPFVLTVTISFALQ